MSRTGGGIGTNQYQVRGTSHRADTSISPAVDLMGQAGTPEVRCGQVWGTACKAKVTGPNWRHGSHGGTANNPSAALPATVLRYLWDTEQIDSLSNAALAKILRTQPPPEISDRQLRNLVAPHLDAVPAHLLADGDMASKLISHIHWGQVRNTDNLQVLVEHPDPRVRMALAGYISGPHARVLVEKAIQDPQLRRYMLLGNKRLGLTDQVKPLINQPDVTEYADQLPSYVLRYLTPENAAAAYAAHPTLEFAKRLVNGGHAAPIADRFIQDHVVSMRPVAWTKTPMAPFASGLAKAAEGDRDKLELLADKGCQQAVLMALRQYDDISAEHMQRWTDLYLHDETVRIKLLSQATAPEQLFRWIYEHPKEKEFRAAIAHEALPDDLLQRVLARARRNPTNMPLWAVARNPKLTADDLKIFLNHPEPRMRKLAMDHPNCPEHIRVLAQMV